MELTSKQRSAKLEAHISLTDLAHNYNEIKRHLSDESTRICCVIKADAYGHGAWECAGYLSSCGADFFAVSSIAEAEEVRRALDAKHADGDILILGYTIPADADLLVRFRITQAVFSEEYALALRDALREYKLDGVIPPNARLPIHIVIDTGMNRIGFAPEDRDTILRVCGIRDFTPGGIFTHFATADTPSSPMTEEQFSRFTACTEALAEKGCTFPLRHVSNSAAITNFPHMQLDMVRYGIELYGLAPSSETRLPDLRPVMTLKTLISHIHTVRKGETVGYGAAFRAEEDMTVATLPVGYADGFIRAYAEGGSVRIRGLDAPICGRICMDQCMVDVSHIPGARIGDEVVLFGRGGSSADEIAARAGTIGYEVLCLIGKRVPRVYTR